MSAASTMAALRKGGIPAAVASAAPSKEEQLEPTDLWRALTSLPRPTKNIPLPRCYPGTDTPVGEVAIWPLTQEEQMAANAEADRWTKDLLKDPQRQEEANLGYAHTYTNECAVQVLFRACRDPENVSRAAFPSPNLMRRELTSDEIGVLFDNYCTVQSELGPIRAHLSPAETEAYILRIYEAGSTFPFDSLSWEERRTLLSTLVSLLMSCWTDMSSAGLPLSVGAQMQKRIAELVSDRESAASPESENEESADEVPVTVEEPVEEDAIARLDEPGHEDTEKKEET